MGWQRVYGQATRSNDLPGARSAHVAQVCIHYYSNEPDDETFYDHPIRCAMYTAELYLHRFPGFAVHTSSAAIEMTDWLAQDRGEDEEITMGAEIRRQHADLDLLQPFAEMTRHLRAGLPIDLIERISAEIRPQLSID